MQSIRLNPVLWDALPVGLILFAKDGTIRQTNVFADRLYPSSGAIADCLGSRHQDQDWPAILDTVLKSGRHWQRTLPIRQSDVARNGEVLLTLLPDLDADGHLQGGAAIIVLDDQRIRSQAQPPDVQRLASIGTLTARVAHELNNPLDGIMRYLNLGIRAIETEQTERLDHYLRQARGGVVRMTDILRELVAFSRGSAAPEPLESIRQTIAEAIKTQADRAERSGVTIETDLQADAPTTAGTNLFQVFCNLIRNSIDAMLEGGTLWIRMAQETGQIRLDFEDTGCGLPEEMERIFEPFFTTKPPGKGTGLGLAICRDLVEKMGGSIIPQQRSGGGTILTVRLPIDKEVSHG